MYFLYSQFITPDVLIASAISLNSSSSDISIDPQFSWATWNSTKVIGIGVRLTTFDFCPGKASFLCVSFQTQAVTISQLGHCINLLTKLPTARADLLLATLLPRPAFKNKPSDIVSYLKTSIGSPVVWHIEN